MAKTLRIAAAQCFVAYYNYTILRIIICRKCKQTGSSATTMVSKEIAIYSEQCNMQELRMGDVLVYDSRTIQKAIQARQR